MNWDRRQFLTLLSVAPVVTPSLSQALRGACADGMWATIQQSSTPTQELPAPTASYRGVVLNDLVASGIVALGEFRSHEVYVSLDDIASDTYMKSLISNYNILAVSSYSYVDRKAKKRDQYSGILLRTVMERLRQDSPDGYVAVQTALSKQSNLEPGTVVRCNVAGPPSSEQTFPLNELLIVSFESGDSRSERFAWLADAIKITERLPGSNLIVPCLGRNWLRNKSIDFADFFDNALRVIPMSGNVKLYLSLYSQWPTFELERAAAAINSSWKRLVS